MISNSERNRIIYDRRRIKLRDIMIVAKSGPCADCGNSYHFCVMDFDHVRGKKKCAISRMYSKKTSINQVLEEIAKCDLVCANCHRLRTFKRSDKWQTTNTPVE